ncbi:hypothetical protein J1614_000840 [Plenodomus biglobosus]|nr:hypothetical protein J1614_000840 [Plenodomus biglobosus]
MLTDSQTLSKLGADLIILCERADRVLAALQVLKSMNHKASSMDGSVEQINFAEIMLLHTEVLETYLRAIQESADILDDEHVAAWINGAGNGDEKGKRKMIGMNVLQKVCQLEKAMGDVNMYFAGDASQPLT